MGFRVWGFGFRASSSRMSVKGFGRTNYGSRFEDSRFRVSGVNRRLAGVRVQGSGFGVQGSGLRVHGSWSRVIHPRTSAVGKAAITSRRIAVTLFVFATSKHRSACRAR